MIFDALGRLALGQVPNAAGPQTLVPSLFTNNNTFYSASVTTTYDLFPSLVSNSNTFYSETVTFYNDVFPDLLINSNSFYSATITTGPVYIYPDLFVNTNTFYTSVETEFLLPPILINQNAINPYHKIKRIDKAGFSDRLPGQRKYLFSSGLPIARVLRI